MQYHILPAKKRIFGNLRANTLLVILNVIAFVIFSVLLLINQNFLNYIALKPSSILQGKYLWTFLTSMFMHAGFFHLFVNMISLMFIGGFIEKIIGRKRYFWFYMISGLIAAALFVLLSFVFPADSDSYAVGASGAIFGLIGLLMFLTPNLPVYVMFIPIPIKLKYAAVGMLVVLWFISIAGNVPIGNVAHLGGLIFGLAYGFYLRKKYRKKTDMIKRMFS